MPDLEYDICVVGGGPAGAVAAYRLATLGYRVGLIEKEGFPRPHVGESLSPGIWALLDSIGLGDLISRAGFLSPGETLLCWDGSQPERVPAEVKGRGLLVDRAIFDSILLLAARQAGVDVLQPFTAQVARVPRGWHIDLKGSSQAHISSSCLIDASGRRGCLSGRRIPFSPPTFATWARVPCGDKDATRVEAIESGWLWAAPVSQGKTSLIFFCGPESLRERRGSLEQWLRRLLAGTQLFSGYAQTPFAYGPCVCDATCGYADEPVDAFGIRVGEASFSLDPLSATGVEKAIQSALVGAIVVHTVREHPDRASLCARYYRERQSETVSLHTAWSLDYYRRPARYAEEPFWAARRGAANRISASSTNQPVPLPPPAPDACLGVGLDVLIADEPCVVCNTIEARPGLRGPMLHRPIVFLDGLEIAPLLADLQRGPVWQDLLASWSQKISPARAQRLALWLWQKGIICEEVRRQDRAEKLLH